MLNIQRINFISKVWEEDLKKVTEIKAHATTVYCLAADGDSLYSCSNDGAIKAWNLNDLKEKGTILQLEAGEIYKIFTQNGLLYSSDEQGTVRVHAGKSIKNIYNLFEPLKDILVVNNLLYTVRDLDVVVTEMKGKLNLLLKLLLIYFVCRTRSFSTRENFGRQSSNLPFRKLYMLR